MAEAETTKTYYLKKGAEHNVILNGEHKLLKGDNGDSVVFTEAQFNAFKDKLQLEPVKAEEKEEPVQVTEQKEPEKDPSASPPTPVKPAVPPQGGSTPGPQAS